MRLFNKDCANRVQNIELARISCRDAACLLQKYNNYENKNIIANISIVCNHVNNYMSTECMSFVGVHLFGENRCVLFYCLLCFYKVYRKTNYRYSSVGMYSVFRSYIAYYTSSTN